MHVGNFGICTQPVNYDKNLPLLRCSILTCDDSSVPCIRMQCLAHPRTGCGGGGVVRASCREMIPKKQVEEALHWVNTHALHDLTTRNHKKFSPIKCTVPYIYSMFMRAFVLFLAFFTTTKKF